MPSRARIRKEYKQHSLTETDVAKNPIEQFTRWWQEAMETQIEDANAMTLCTVAADGKPKGRIVLLKDYDEKGFVFYTNYQSNKAADLFHHPFAALVFFWKELERQVRVNGTVTVVAELDSDEYFQSRPADSRLGAWASPQSKEIAGREVLENNLAQLELQFPDGNIPRPPHWGGYCILPESIEFWQGRPSRLHDRILYEREGSQWVIKRLAP